MGLQSTAWAKYTTSDKRSPLLVVFSILDGHDSFTDHVIPVPGATNIQVVLFPAGYPAGPASQSAVIDREAAAREYLERLPGLAETFERDEPAMHATPTVDYAVVLEGEIWQARLLVRSSKRPERLFSKRL